MRAARYPDLVQETGGEGRPVVGRSQFGVSVGRDLGLQSRQRAANRGRIQQTFTGQILFRGRRVHLEDKAESKVFSFRMATILLKGQSLLTTFFTIG